MKDNGNRGNTNTTIDKRDNPLGRTILRLLAQTDEADWPDIVWVLRQYAHKNA